MNRFQASGIHFGISFLVGAILLVLSWYVWYPEPMLTSIGGHQIFLLIVGIDVIVGPLLTMVVYKTGKKSLKFDLAVIAMLQIGAMTYGVSTLLEARPVYVAAVGDEFQVVLATQVTDANMAKAGAVFSWWGPVWVGTKAPESSDDKLLVNDLKAVGAGRGHVPALHIPYEQMKSEVLQNSFPIAELKIRNPDKVEEINDWLGKFDHSDSTAKYQRIRISAYEFVVVLDATSGDVIGIAPFKP